jgi:hypothetical protein
LRRFSRANPTRDPASAEELPEFPERQADELLRLAHGEPALFVQMNGELDSQLFDGQASRVQDVLGYFEVGGGRHGHLS